MKKRFLFALTFLICSNIFCQTNFISPEETQIILKQSVQYNFLTNQKNNTTGFSTRAVVDMNELRLDLGLNGVGEKIDLTFRSIYWPSFASKKLNLGIGFLYHLYVFPYQYTENDFKAGLYFRIYFAKKYCFVMDLNYYGKRTVFNYNIPALVNHSVNIDLLFLMQINENMKVYTGMLSNTFFDYPLSFEPNFIIGIENYCTKNFLLGAEFYIDWVDIISAVANIHQVNLKIIAGYRF